MVLIGGAALLSWGHPPRQSPTDPATQDPAPVVRRLAATAQLAAQEYRVGIVDGRVVSQAEVDEARLFLQESRRLRPALPAELSRGALAEIDSVLRLVGRMRRPDSVDARVRRLTDCAVRRSGSSLDEIPAQTPSLARGAEVYQANCAGCHGTLGSGDGPAAAGLEPKPANLADGPALMDQSPLDYLPSDHHRSGGDGHAGLRASAPGSGPLGCGAVRHPAPASRPFGRQSPLSFIRFPSPDGCRIPSCSPRSG